MSKLPRSYNLFLISIVLFLFFVSINNASAVVSVGYTGNLGTYNCDGTNDEVQIQQALNAAHTGSDHTVYLKGPHTYWVDNPMTMYSGTTLTGDSTAEIKLVANANWARSWKSGQYTYPLIRNANYNTVGSAGWYIHGFTIDGNSESQTGVTPGTGGYYTMIWFDGGTYDIHVSDMRFEWGSNDALKVYGPSSTQVTSNDMKILMEDCDVYNAGHEAGYFLRCNNVTFRNNVVYTRVNGAARIEDGYNGYIYNNEIYSNPVSGSTGPGIELDKTNFNNIHIYYNTIHDLRGAAVWAPAENTVSGTWTAQNVYIYNNVIYNVGNYASSAYSNAAIVMYGFKNFYVYNNVIDDGGSGGIKIYKRSTTPTAPGSGYNLIAKNNIIMHTSGPALWNLLSSSLASTHTITATYNDIYSVSSTYSGSSITIGTGNLYGDPSVYSRASHDYHLKSRGGRWTGSAWVSDTSDSPCIDAGDPASTYSTEPSPNGGRINIGAYGNTAYASKTYTTGGGSAPTGSISASPTPISSGSSSTLTWTSSDATSASISGIGSVATSGNQAVSPTSTTTYTLSLSNSYGTSTYSATVTVSGSTPAASGYDTRIKSSEATSNFATLAYLDIGNIDGTKNYRDFVKFNLTDYYGDDMHSVLLGVYWYYPEFTRTKETHVGVYQPTKNWVHSETTWNKANASTSWSNAGGDWIDRRGTSNGAVSWSNQTFTADALPQGGEYVWFDITNITEYYTTHSTNYGYMLKATTEDNNYIAFSSFENGNSSRVPILYINPYTTDIYFIYPTSSNINMDLGKTQRFYASTLGYGTFWWYVDGVLTHIETDGTQHGYNYYYTPLTDGTHNVTVETTEDSYTWNINVIDTDNTDISSYYPNSLTPSINRGSTQTFTFTPEQSDIITWYLDGALQEIESANPTSTFYYKPMLEGEYNITAIGSRGENVTWTLTALNPPLAITSTTPSDILVTYAGYDNTFNLKTNLVANVTWYLGDVAIETDLNTTNASFTYSPLYGGSYNILGSAIAFNQSVEHTWYWTVRGPSEDDNETTGGTNQEKIERIKVDIVSNIDASMRLAGILIVVTVAISIIAILVGVWQKRIKVNTACAAILVMSIGGSLILIGLQILEKLIDTW